ncbi:MAG: response regulator [Alphaproteobacteria bacterium]
MNDGLGFTSLDTVTAIIWGAAACVTLYVIVPSKSIRAGLAAVSAILIALALLMKIGVFGPAAVQNQPSINSQSLLILSILPMLLAALLGARYRHDRAIQRHALASTDGAVAVFDLKGKLQYVNAAFVRLVGLKNAQDAVGREAHDFFSDKEEAAAVLRTVLDSGDWHGETSTRTVSGENRDAQIGLSLARDPEGTPTAIIGSFADIGERRRTQQELRLNQSLLTAVGEVAPVVLWSAGKDKTLQFATGMGLDSWPPEGADQDSSAPFQPGASLEILFEETPEATVYVTRAERGYTSSFIHTLGGVAVQTSVGPQLDASGRVIGFVGVSMVAGSGQSEIELTADTALNQDAHQQLETVSRMTGGIAHDFNNLLTTMLGHLDLVIEQAGKDTDMYRFACAAAHAAERGADLTERLLSFAQRKKVSPVATDLNALVTDLSAHLGSALPQTCKIQVQEQENSVWAYVDPGQLKTAIGHLTDNALDAMPAGGTLTLRILEDTNLPPHMAGHPLAQKSCAAISVCDTGTGMPPEVAARACHPFFTTKQEGSAAAGLGLSLVQGFLADSEGAMHIESDVADGTTVTLYLPAATAAQTDTSAAAATGGRIMVVEDDPDVRDFIVNALKRLGHTVIWAEDGPQALNLATENENIDLLISDVVLPGEMTGPDVVKRLLQRFPETKVLFTSGYLGDDLKTNGGLSQDAELLSKPYTIQALSEKVRDALGPTLH